MIVCRPASWIFSQPAAACFVECCDIHVPRALEYVADVPGRGQVYAVIGIIEPQPYIMRLVGFIFSFGDCYEQGICAFASLADAYESHGPVFGIQITGKTEMRFEVGCMDDDVALGVFAVDGCLQGPCGVEQEGDLLEMLQRGIAAGGDLGHNLPFCSGGEIDGALRLAVGIGQRTGEPTAIQRRNMVSASVRSFTPM